MNRSTPGLPVHHQLPEFTQTHVHQVGDAIQLATSDTVQDTVRPQRWLWLLLSFTEHVIHVMQLD